MTVAPHGVLRQRDTANGVVVVRMQPALCPTDEQFYEFCRLNNELRIERDTAGDMSIRPPAGWETAAKNAEITHQLQDWARMNGTGRAADSSAGYVLPNGAIRSPDASWVSNERLAALSTDQRSRFLPICPDFVIELRSATDPLPPLRAKMSEYMACGAVLAWLIDLASRQVVVYRGQLAAEELDSPTSVSGDPEMPGFRLLLVELWPEPG